MKEDSLRLMKAFYKQEKMIGTYFLYLIFIIASTKTYFAQQSLELKDAPAFSFYSFKGEKISLDQYEGKVLLLDFWESWCGHCIKSFPELNRIAAKYKDKGIEVLGVITENRKTAERLIKKNKLTYENIFADKSIIKNYGVSSRPTYFLIDKTGKIIMVSYGSLETVERKLKEIYRL